MNTHDIINALGSKETLRGYFGTFLSITLGFIDISEMQSAMALAGGFFGMMLTIISIYAKIQEVLKRKKELDNDD